MLFKPTKGSSYLKLPIELQHHKKGLINLQNKDNECFRWCHICHLNPMDKDSQRIKKSDPKYVSELNYDGVVFPVSIKQINKIELQNKININVFGYENKQPYPYQYSYLQKNLKITWNYCLYLKMRINILCTSKILIDLCLTKPSIKTKNIFVCIVCNV